MVVLCWVVFLLVVWKVEMIGILVVNSYVDGRIVLVVEEVLEFLG